MAFILRTAMNGKVLKACMELVMSIVRIALQTVHHRTAHDCGKIRIFSIGLLSSSPPRVTENVYIRSPYGKAMIYLHTLFRRTCHIELYTLLRRSHIEDLLQKNIVPARCQTYSLREYRGKAIAGRSVKSLIPPVVLSDAEFRNCWRLIVHQCDLLLH